MPTLGQKVPPMASSAWISPTGDFFFVDFASHSDVAYNVFGDPSVQSKGWLHLSGGRVFFDRLPTQAQIDTLFDVSMAYHSHPEPNYLGGSRRTLAEEMERLDQDLSDIIDGKHRGY